MMMRLNRLHMAVKGSRDLAFEAMGVAMTPSWVNG